jgi:hypothetical protein
MRTIAMLKKVSHEAEEVKNRNSTIVGIYFKSSRGNTLRQIAEAC